MLWWLWIPHLAQGYTHWGPKREIKEMPPPESSSLAQSWVCIMPASSSSPACLPPSSLLCIPSLGYRANPSPLPHPLQLTQQVAQGQIAMGKDSQAHWRGYFARGPLYLKLSSKAEMTWFAFSHWSMQSSWGVFLVTKNLLLWFALGPSLGLEQLWRHLYAAHLNMSFRQIFFRGFQRGKTNAFFFSILYTLFLQCWRQKLTLSRPGFVVLCLSFHAAFQVQSGWEQPSHLHSTIHSFSK